MLHFVDIALGSGDAVRCTRCGGRPTESTRDAADVIADVEAACGSASGGAGPNVALGGSEPLAHPGLADIVSAAVRAGAHRIRLDTDAVPLARAEDASSVLSAGVRHLRTTLLGGTPDTHDALAGTPGAFEDTLAGMRGFAEAAERADAEVHVTTRVPVCRHNLGDLPMAVTAAAEAGAGAVYLIIADAGLDVRQAVPWMAAACETGVVNGVWVECEGVPYCLAPGLELHLTPTYRSVEGAKPASCDACATTTVCPGGMPGASPAVMAWFRRPADATRIAEEVARGSAAPEEVRS